ncbi:hypothetical protein PoB_002189100 [Plakobranchus ocellatus]|uniref:Uncharacterized protein n=1 Tax=Plakobranchus ocellatus TaxID=259542 RepID=A0AAV3ZHK0_9GAST|nr:hypothetical protein PoB_002189100 [Plakobranchus ocellatus]
MKPLPFTVYLLLIGLAEVCVGMTKIQLDNAIGSAYKSLQDRLDKVETYFGNLARQVMLQQFNSEQRIRTDGYSGVKAVRSSSHGPANYYSNSYVGSRHFIAVHDHANFIRTVGLGEINAVINGVEFTTRHNDYKLVMSSTKSTGYHDTEPIPFPDIPPSVLKLKDVDDQIEEMRTYFKAFATQNTTLRDYRPYFKANLCYMEGAWTLDKSIEEPFESDRHQLDAASWLELQSLIRYGAYTGTKSPLENFAHLPTAIMHVNKTTGLRLQSYGYPLYLPYGDTNVLQDTSRYARATKLGGKDAMGNKFLARGFNDPNLWCAETTQPRVAPIITEKCTTEKAGKMKVETCESIETRLSWAIPLEIVYMTPLLSWNPYRIPYTNNRKAATASGRYDGSTKRTAYNGTDLSHYYLTPVQFYKGRIRTGISADTARGGVWVRDRKGEPRKCSASGPRMVTPNIEGTLLWCSQELCVSSAFVPQD